MRLAQIARKVKVTPVEVKRFLEEKFEIEIGKDPNYKLEEKHIDAVLENFVVETESNQTETNSPAEEEKEPLAEPVAEETAAVETAIEEAEESIETQTTDEEAGDETEAAEDDQPEAETEAAEDDQPEAETEEEESEEDAFVEMPVDPDAELIKAPKVKLDGLKILGKIELPEKKVEEEPEKTEEEIQQEEEDKIAELDAAMRSQAQDIKTSSAKSKSVVVEEEESEENARYKDKNGIYHFSDEQRRNRIQRLEEFEEIKKQEQLKLRKKEHYEQLMKSREPKKSVKAEKAKMRKTENTKRKKAEQSKPKPTGIWAKFVHWLND